MTALEDHLLSEEQLLIFSSIYYIVPFQEQKLSDSGSSVSDIFRWR
jgi:hypothetical protein